MIKKLILFGLFLIFLPPGSFGENSSKWVNGTAAIINKKVISIQDAFVYRALQRAKTGMQPVILEEEGDDLRKTVQKIVFEEMVIAEMKNLGKEFNVQSEVAKWISGQRGGALDLVKKKYGLSEQDISRKMANTLGADRFVQLKIETVTPVITEEESQKYFKRNEAQFRGKSFESIKPNIIVLLKKQAVQKNLEEWIKSLKDKYEVSMLLDNG
ncbi:MAG: hypothetical protein ACKOA8_16700 [Deltaproteobacteria bacterium]